VTDQNLRLTVPPPAGLPDDVPHNALVLTARGLTGTATGGVTRFDLGVDAGTVVGSAVQVRVSYDLTGDGTWDRSETFRYFATDPLPGTERYTDAIGTVRTDGAAGDLRGGTVRVEVWCPIGSAPSTLVLAGASVSLPFG
jgi:hypothetical protein